MPESFSGLTSYHLSKKERAFSLFIGRGANPYI